MLNRKDESPLYTAIGRGVIPKLFLCQILWKAAAGLMYQIKYSHLCRNNIYSKILDKNNNLSVNYNHNCSEIVWPTVIKVIYYSSKNYLLR